uniref:Uncharacterized protein n=1 Tax=uncultured marine virus TaxID=186617 RepID=A0A0F7LAG6_9VIRU|nr:hypothetical protein [uncultured marine virus]
MILCKFHFFYFLCCFYFCFSRCFCLFSYRLNNLVFLRHFKTPCWLIIMLYQ